MAYILETERLRLREFTTADCDFLIELMNSRGWLKFIGDRNVRTREEAENYLRNGPMKSYEVNGYGLWVVERKDDSCPMGMCGILKRDMLDFPDIGFAFLPAYSGNRYALEIAGATLTYAKETLGLSKIAAITMAENIRAITLLQKIGMRYLGNFSFSDSSEELLLYSN